MKYGDEVDSFGISDSPTVGVFEYNAFFLNSSGSLLVHALLSALYSKGILRTCMFAFDKLKVYEKPIGR